MADARGAPWRGSTWPRSSATARACAASWRGRRAVRRRQGRRLRPRRGRRAPRRAGRRRDLARGRRAAEARELRAAGIDARSSCMGALTRRGARRRARRRADIVAWREPFVDALAARRRRRGCTSSSTPAWAGSARATPARRRGSPTRSPRPRELELAGADDPLRHRRRAGRRLLRPSSSRASRAWAERAARAPPGRRRPRRQQRRDAARPGDATSTSCAAASRSTASTRSSATRPSTASSPRSSCSSYVAEVKPIARRARAPATAGASSPSEPTTLATVPIGYGDGVRRALTEQRRRPRSAGGAGRSSGR